MLLMATLTPDHPDLIPLFNADRAWAAYALCDLDPTYLHHCTFIGALTGSGARTVLMVFDPGAFTSLSAYGDAALLPPLLDYWRRNGNTTTATVLARPQDIAAYQAAFRTTPPFNLFRMVVTPAKYREPLQPDGYTFHRLQEENLQALQSLYAIWPETVFTPYMLSGGVYVGAFRDGVLVAAAGTHGVHPPQRIAMIGNVYTDPAERRRGLAQACTSRVVADLFDLGATDVALNVKVHNAPAIAAYQRLGFQTALTFSELRCTV